MKKTVLLLISLFLLLSCSDPNIYTAMGYDPLSRLTRTAKTVSVPDGSSFNVLSLAPMYDYDITIDYTVRADRELLVSLDEEQTTALIQAIDYLSRTGRLEATLGEQLPDELKRACYDTKAFIYLALEDLDQLNGRILDEIEQAGISLNTSALEDFLGQLLELMDPQQHSTTVEDYLAIQLAENVVSAILQCLQIIILDIPQSAVRYTWSTVSSDEFLSVDGLVDSISENAVELIGVIIRSVADLDQVSSNIPTFFSLTTVINEVLG